MAELTISTLIKIIVGLVVVVIVIFGVAVSFNNYIKPFFGGLFPSVEENKLTPSEAAILLKPENLIATIVVDPMGPLLPKIYRILEVNGNTKNYRVAGEKIRRVQSWHDIEVGFINEKNKVVIENFREDAEFLKKLNGATYVISSSGNAFYKKQSDEK